MPRRRQSSPVGPVLAAVVVSLLAHLVLWPVGNHVVQLGRSERLPEPADSVMEVTLAPDPDKEPTADPESEMRDPVRVDAVPNERRPEDPKRVSEFDSSTDRETVAPSRRRTPAPRGNPKASDRQDAAPESSPQEDTKRAGTALPLGGARSAGEQGASREGGDATATPSPPAPSVAPSPRVLQGLPGGRGRTWGGPGNTDKIDDVDEGAATILDTQRWKYASFFNRMKNDIDQYWDPVARLRARDPDGRINGSKTRTTRVMIILNADGSLDKIKLQRSCNVDYLDDEALRAIRSAAPFPNPPKGMLDPRDGKLHVPFGFIVEMGKGRIHRYRR